MAEFLSQDEIDALLDIADDADIVQKSPTTLELVLTNSDDSILKEIILQAVKIAGGTITVTIK